MNERWEPVVGYEGSYEVSDQGRVRSLDRTVLFSDGRKRFYAGRLCKTKPHNQAGYPMAALSRGPEKRWALVHQIVMESFVGPRPFGKEVCHENGIVTDARLSNLRYDTRAGNHADKRRHGTHREGANHHLAQYAETVIDGGAPRQRNHHRNRSGSQPESHACLEHSPRQKKGINTWTVRET